MPKTVITQHDYDVLHEAFTVELQQNGSLACQKLPGKPVFSKGVYAASAHDLLEPLYDVRRENQLVVFTSDYHHTSKHVVEVHHICHDWKGTITGTATIFSIPRTIILVDENTWENQ